VLVVAIAALGAAVFMTATGGLGRIMTALGATVDGVLERSARRRRSSCPMSP
jgi:hypothetical protein